MINGTQSRGTFHCSIFHIRENSLITFAMTSNFIKKKKMPFGMVLTAAGAMLGILTLTGFLGKFWWVFDLTAHFRVQYFIALGILTSIYLFLGKYQLASFWAILSLANLSVIVPLYFGSTPKPIEAESIQSYRALLLNVNTANRNFEDVRKFLKQCNADFIVLEEVNLTWMKEFK